MALLDRFDPSDCYVDRFVFALRHFGPDETTPVRLRGEERKAGRAASTIRHLLLELAVFADWDNGECWPSRETIAGRMAVSPNTVSSAIQMAEAAGWLTVRDLMPPSRRAGKDWNRNIYRLLIPREVEARLLNEHARTATRHHDSDASSEAGSLNEPPNPSDVAAGSLSEAAGSMRDGPGSFNAPKQGRSTTTNLSREPSKNPPMNVQGGLKIEGGEVGSPRSEPAIPDLAEPPPGWAPPEELEDHRHLWEALSGDEARWASEAARRRHGPTVGPHPIQRPADLSTFLDGSDRLRLQYAVASRNGDRP